MAKSLEVTDRTLRNWERSYSSPKRRGRPRKAITLKEKIKIGREWKRQGFPGSRPVIYETGLRARAVREVIAALDGRRRKRAELHRKKHRVRMKAKQAHAFAVMDGASLTKGNDYLVFRDRATLSVEATACRGHLNAKHTLALLERLRCEGRLPYVLGTDNGSPFCAHEVQHYLRCHKVVHLKSLPRVPQQNGSAENAVYEFKRLAKVGLTAQACKILNQHRRRASLGWQTAAEVGQNVQVNQITRSRFYEEVQANIKSAVHGTQSVYAGRKAEREAILQTMEGFELITRTRGGVPLRAKTEAIT